MTQKCSYTYIHHMFTHKCATNTHPLLARAQRRRLLRSRSQKDIFSIAAF